MRKDITIKKILVNYYKKLTYREKYIIKKERILFSVVLSLYCIFKC